MFGPQTYPLLDIAIRFFLFCLIIANYITFVALEVRVKRIARTCEDMASMQHAIAQELARTNDLKSTELETLGILGNDRNRPF